MYENYPNGGAIGMPTEAMLKSAVMERTIGENIDQRIAGLQAEIKRLEGVKEQLKSGASLLDVKIRTCAGR